MKLHLAQWTLFLSLLASIAVLTFWVGSVRHALHIVWTSGSAHYQVTSRCGQLNVIQNENWWRDESLAWITEPCNSCEPITEWPGFFEKVHRCFIGFEFARGDYVSTFVATTANDRVTPDAIRDRVKPGTMLRTTTQFKQYAVPYWFLTALASVALVNSIWRRQRIGRQSSVQSGHSEAGAPSK